MPGLMVSLPGINLVGKVWQEWKIEMATKTVTINKLS